MPKRTGHTRGGSHSRKKWDRVKKRNYYARELLDPRSPFRTSIIPGKTKDKISEAEILEDLDEED